MSYFEDFEEDKLGSIEFDYLMAPRIRTYSFQRCEDKWINIHGEEVELKSMETKYLYNCISMINRICYAENLDPSDYRIYDLILEEISSRK